MGIVKAHICILHMQTHLYLDHLIQSQSLKKNPHQVFLMSRNCPLWDKQSNAAYEEKRGNAAEEGWGSYSSKVIHSK